VIEELLAEKGLVPDIDDDRFGAAYDNCPPVARSVVKNAAAFAHVLAKAEAETASRTLRLGHVDWTEAGAPLDWAFFAVDLRRFPLTAVFSAMVQALAARVEGLAVHVSGPVTDAFLFGCDFLSAHQVFTGDPGPVLRALASEGQGICIDLAGLKPDHPRTVSPDPARYGVEVLLPDSDYVRAYRAVTAELEVQGRPYISYGGEAGSAPVVMAGRLLGCWLWDCITPDTFRRVNHTFS
jgi:hypothetical protein